MTDSYTIPLKDAQPSPAVEEADASAYFELLKPRVMSLVIFTAFVGMLAAPGSLHPVLSAVAILLIAIGAGASAALNMWVDADIDAEMDRTKSRPIPSGRVTKGEALAFGVVLSVFSVVLLALTVNLTSAVLLAVTIFFYAVVYSMWLKRRTPQNIVIGGAAGAFPPVIGWAAVTNSITVESLVLFAIIFLWTPPHFWALALFNRVRDDYARVGVPMMPVVLGFERTRLEILLYSLAVVPVAVLPSVMGFAGPVYGAVSVLLGAVFLWLAVQVFRKQTEAEKHLFLFSIFYLFTLFATLGAERVISAWV